MPDQHDFEVFTHWRTSAGFRVRVALNLKGLSARERYIDIDKGDQHRPDFRAINPLGSVPVLVQPGHPPLSQSLAILEYLDECVPTPPLLPADAFGRARVRSIAAMMAADTHPLITPRMHRYLAAEAGFETAAWRAWVVHWFTTGLQALEQRLQNEPQTGTFCHGDTVTIADICVASILSVARVLKITVADIPTVDRIVAACDAIEAFQKANPLLQEGAPAPSKAP